MGLIRGVENRGPPVVSLARGVKLMLSLARPCSCNIFTVVQTQQVIGR